MGLAGPETRAGPRRSSGLPAELGWKEKREGREKEKWFSIFKIHSSK
jgi:hypothetical protein